MSFSHNRIDELKSTQFEDLTQVSLRGFQKLKTLRIDGSLLRAKSSTMAFDNEEKSDGGFYEEDSDTDSDTDFDLRSLLPASLEKIYIGNNWETNEAGQCTTFLEHHDVPGIYTNPLMKYLEGQG
jgi:hypothetical protein